VRRLAAILVLLLSAGQGAAQEPVDLPDRAAIRAFYDQVVVEPLPEIMVHAMVAANGPRSQGGLRFTPTLVDQLAHLMLPVGRRGKDERAILAARLQEELGSDAVQLYAETVYMGRGCYGARAAAWAFFGEPVEDLILAQVAALAALPKSPVLFDPEHRPEPLRDRRVFVLSKMLRRGIVTQAEAEAAWQAPLGLASPPGRCEGVLTHPPYAGLNAR
jgi:penicillin-binding protein 1A